jgi:hypothetical protein
MDLAPVASRADRNLEREDHHVFDTTTLGLQETTSGYARLLGDLLATAADDIELRKLGRVFDFLAGGETPPPVDLPVAASS